MKIRKAIIEDLSELLILQKMAFFSEAQLYNNYSIQPLVQTIEELRKEFSNPNKTFLVYEDNDKIIGSLRIEVKGDLCSIEKVIVHPDHQNQGIGTQLMKKVEEMYNDSVKFQLFTGKKSIRNIAFYKKMGYMVIKQNEYIDDIHMVFMEKENKKY